MMINTKTSVVLLLLHYCRYYFILRLGHHWDKYQKRYYDMKKSGLCATWESSALSLHQWVPVQIRLLTGTPCCSNLSARDAGPPCSDEPRDDDDSEQRGLEERPPIVVPLPRGPEGPRRWYPDARPLSKLAVLWRDPEPDPEPDDPGLSRPGL
jgi:hypothetical protein